MVLGVLGLCQGLLPVDRAGLGTAAGRVPHKSWPGAIWPGAAF